MEFWDMKLTNLFWEISWFLSSFVLDGQLISQRSIRKLKPKKKTGKRKQTFFKYLLHLWTVRTTFPSPSDFYLDFTLKEKQETAHIPMRWWKT